MSRDSAETSGTSNVILQGMGLQPDVSVAMGKVDLRQLDCLVLCSDGLSNKVTDGEIGGVLLSSTRLDSACNRLVEVAKQRGGEDNITAIVAGVRGDLPPHAPGESIAETISVLQEFEPPPG
jgi:protein phosphatase